MMDRPAEVQAQSRAAVYGFLAWLFLNQPDAEFISHFLANDVQENLQIFPIGSEATSIMVAGLKKMHSSLLEIDPYSAEEISRELAVCHTRSMRGVGKAYGPPPPYESLYCENEAGDDSALLLQLTEFYHQAEAAVPAENAERVDFLGIELDLMRLLCEEENRFLEEGLPDEAGHAANLQQRFLRQHLMVWAPIFCQSFIAQAGTGFYQGVAQLLLGFLETERQFIDQRPVEGHKISGDIAQVLEKG